MILKFFMLNNIEQSNKEKQEQREKGKNINLIISFLRHGEKDKEGELTAHGFQQAKSLGKDKNIKNYNIKMYTSPFRRTVSTVDAILKGIKKQERENKIFNTRRRITLAPPEWKNFKTIAKKGKEAEKEKGHAGLFHYIMTEPLAQKDLEHWTSSLAYMIKLYRKGSHHFYSGSEVELQHITHDVVIGDFLRKVAVFKDENGKRIKNVNFDELDGHINFLEGFEFKVHLDENGKESCKIVFRGQELEIDEEKLNKLVKIYKDSPYEGRITRQNYKNQS